MSFRSGIGQRQVAVERRPGDAQRLADLVDAQSAVLVQALGGHHTDQGTSQIRVEMHAKAPESSTLPA